jgi:hypothetical protein
VQFNQYVSENKVILTRKAHHLIGRSILLFMCTFALAALIQPLRAQQLENPSQQPNGEGISDSSGAWHSDQAVHLIGLPEIKEKVKGSLSISPATLSFAAPEGHASIERSKILTVTVGDVRVETGGTAGKITRAIIPYGGGSVLATVTNKQVSLLTIEFRDERNALHGTVFLLPKNEAVQAQQQLGPQTAPAPVETPHGSCQTSGGAPPDTIQVAAIAVQGEPVPAEYRVLLYEQLLRQLRKEGSFTGVYRVGDDAPAAACPKYSLVLTVNAFKKGNAAVRASIGPLGFFVGTTTMKFHVQVQDLNRKMLFDKDIQASERGDSDSLNVANKIAKSLTKSLNKATASPDRS